MGDARCPDDETQITVTELGSVEGDDAVVSMSGVRRRWKRKGARLLMPSS